MTFRTPLLALLLAASLAGCVATTPRQMTAVVIGGGQSGAPLTRILKSQGYAVRVMVRDPSRARDLPEGVQVVAGDVTQPATLVAALAGADYVLSTIGANCVPRQPFPRGGSPEDVDFRGIENLAAEAKRAGVRQFVLMSSIGAGDADPQSTLNAMCGMILQWKGRGEDSLRASGVPYTIVRPGGLKPFPGQPACSEGIEGLVLYDARDARAPGAVCRADVGLVMAAALGRPDALGKTVNLIGDGKVQVGAWREAWKDLPRD